jgi:hypothetical protein
MLFNDGAEDGASLSPVDRHQPCVFERATFALG